MRLHALQYLRAFAALAVVYSHTAIQVEDYAQYLTDVGSFGVDIFFCDLRLHHDLYHEA